MTDTELERLLQSLVRVKRAADGGVALISNQGQALDGISELYNYRSIVQDIDERLTEIGKPTAVKRQCF